MPSTGLKHLSAIDARIARLLSGDGSLRVGLVVERFDPLRGGLEQWTYRFARELLSRGHEVHLVSREFGAATRELPIFPHTVECGPSRLAFAEEAQAVLLPLELDVIHDMGSGWYCDIFQPHGGSWASVTHRKLDMLPGWWRWLKRRLNPFLPRHRQYRRLMARQYADRGQVLLALSRSVADDFTRFHQVAPERIRIVYNGVDTTEYSPQQCAPRRDVVRQRLGIGRNTLLALVVAHNFQLKGIPTLLHAMARLRVEGRPVHLVVVGGKRLSGWRRRARRLGVGECVTFVGPARDTLDYYAAADLYVHPTFYDTCSLVVLEAAACGLPIITSRYNGAAELLRDRFEALVISDPADVEQLAEAICELSAEPLRRRMGQAARQAAMRHTLDDNVEQILEVYREVLRRRGGQPHGYAVVQARVPARKNSEFRSRISGLEDLPGLESRVSELEFDAPSHRLPDDGLPNRDRAHNIPLRRISNAEPCTLAPESRTLNPEPRPYENRPGD